MSSSTAENRKVKVGDVVSFDFVIYDSRSGITKKPDEVVAAGIRNYLAHKPIRYRHVDPNEDAYSLMGDVSKTIPPVFNRLADVDGKPYMEVVQTIELKARSEHHAAIINDMIERERLYTETGDQSYLMGVSLGWIENSAEFVPHELSITPYPRCPQCIQVPGMTMMSATAEACRCNGEGVTSNEGEKQLDEKIAQLKENLFDQKLLIKGKDTEIASLKAELSDVKLKAQESLQSKVAEIEKQYDTQLAEKNSTINTLNEEIESLKAEVKTAQTLPLRKEIAEDILGFKAEEATRKMESLKNMSVEGLTQMRDDLKHSAKIAAEKAEKDIKSRDEPMPFLAGAQEITPNVAEGVDYNSMTDEQAAEAFLGKDFFASIGRGR